MIENINIVSSVFGPEICILKFTIFPWCPHLGKVESCWNFLCDLAYKMTFHMENILNTSIKITLPNMLNTESFARNIYFEKCS